MHDHHFDTKMVSRLENESRIEELKPYDLLRNVAGVSEGMTCVDLGCGTGVFTIPMAEIAGKSGKVYGVDNSAELLEHLRRKKPPANIILINSDVRETGLESGIADFCLLAFILHEVKDPEVLVAEAHRLLKSDGKIIAVDWRADAEGKGPPVSIRLKRTRVQQIFKSCHFKVFQYQDWSVNHYAITGIK